MARAGLDKDTVIEKAAQLANHAGFENITLKILADSLNVQPPSLYNHIKGLEDLQNQLMLYGWRHMEERMSEDMTHGKQFAGRSMDTPQKIPVYSAPCSGITNTTMTKQGKLWKNCFRSAIGLQPP